MESISDVLRLVTDTGVTALAIGFLFYIMYVFFIKTFPTQEEYAAKLEEITKANQKAIIAWGHSQDNFAKTLDALNITLEGQSRLIELLINEAEGTRQQLYLHDNRCNQLYELLDEVKELRNRQVKINEDKERSGQLD